MSFALETGRFQQLSIEESVVTDGGTFWICSDRMWDAAVSGAIGGAVGGGATGGPKGAAGGAALGFLGGGLASVGVQTFEAIRDTFFR